MLIKLVTTKTVSENATALQVAVQFHNENCRSVKAGSKHRGAWSISDDGRAK
jgi:hypothetical protein